MQQPLQLVFHRFKGGRAEQKRHQLHYQPRETFPPAQRGCSQHPYASPRPESHKFLANLPPLGLQILVGVYDPAFIKQACLCYSQLTPNTGGIYLHIAPFQNNIHRFLCHSADPQQVPAEYQESETTLQASEPGPGSFYPSHERMNRSENKCN